MRIKHDKKGKENTIGKIIYGFLLFMPLLAIGVTCAYAIFNKNAYKSYDYEEKSNLTEITNTNQFKENLQYTLVYVNNSSSTTNTTGVISYSNISIDWSDYTTAVGNWDRFEITYNTGNSNIYIYLYRENESSYGTYLTNKWQEIKQLTFTATSTSATNRALPNRMVNGYQLTIIKTSNLNNVFYYSIDKVQQSPLFNWSNDTATYNVLQSTCNTLGITTLFVPMLLSYWLMISLMYLLYDIALLVVHMAHKKIHDIESSI